MGAPLFDTPLISFFGCLPSVLVLLSFLIVVVNFPRLGLISSIGEGSDLALLNQGLRISEEPWQFLVQSMKHQPPNDRLVLRSVDQLIAGSLVPAS